MKNLKRILSLALASTMLIGMMVVGASAATVTDLDEVEHQTAAQTLLALGIMTGAEQLDGSLAFAPDGKLDRQAMAVMLARLINKGSDPDFADTDKPSFVDVKAGGWNVKYIEYCANFGVINGYGNGYFGPADELTPTQAARMMLNAMGYTWDGNGSWELATEVQARELGLYDDLDDDILGKAMTRDDAAQMLYNALTAPMADGKSYTYEEPAQVVIGLETEWQISLLTPPTSADLATGKTADDWTRLEGKSYPTKAQADAVVKAVFPTAKRDQASGNNYELNDILVAVYDPDATVTKTAVESLAHKYLGLEARKTNMYSVVDYYGLGYLVNGAYLVEEDVSNLMGHEVVALVKLDKNGDVDFTYGITDAAVSVVYEGTVGGYSVPAGGTSINNAIRGTTVVEFNNFTATHSTVANIKGNSSAGISALPSEWKLTIIRNINENGGTYFTAVVTPVELGKIANITSTRYTLTERSDLLNVASLEIEEDVLGYEGIAVGDYVAVVPADNTLSGLAELTKVNDIVTGTVTAVRTNQVQIDGTWYTQASDPLTGTASVTNALLGNDVTLVNLNGYFAFAQADVSVSRDLIILTHIANTANTSTLHNSIEAQALFLADGTTATIKIDNVGGTPVAVGTTPSTVLDEDSLYTYTVSSAGFYTVYPAIAGTTGNGATGYTETVDSSEKLIGSKIGAYLIADDATVVVKYVSSGDKYKVLDGATVKGWKAIATDNITTSANVAGFGEYVRNVPYLQVLVLTTNGAGLPGATGVDGNYGYVTSTPYKYADTTTTEKTYVWVYNVWTGTEEITVYDTTNGNSASAGTARGRMIEFEDLGNGRIKSTPIATQNYAVKGYAQGDEILYLAQVGTAANPYELDKDAIIFYINNDTKKGVDSGIISNADAIFNATNGKVLGYYKNVMAVIENGKITFLVIDITNDLDDPTYVTP